MESKSSFKPGAIDGGYRTRVWHRMIATITPKNIVIYGSIIFLLWLALSPLVMLLWGSFRSAGPGVADSYFTFENYIRAFSEPYIYVVLWNTIIFTAGATVVALAVGIGVAWMVERTNIYFRDVIFVLMVIRLAVPQILMAMSWILLLSPEIGWINRVLQSITGIKGLINIYSMGGMIWVQGIDMAPLVFLLAAGAFRSLDPTFEEAALMSGARLRTIFRYITLPLIIPAMAAAILLVVLMNFEAFDVPVLIGLRHGIQTFASAIYFITSGEIEQLPMASTFSIVFFILAVVGLYYYQRVTAESKKYMTITGKGYRPRRVDIGPWRLWVSLIVITFLVFSYIIPILLLLWGSFQPFYNVPSLEGLSRMSLQNYSIVLDLASTKRGFRNSIFLAISTATLAMILTAILSWLLVRMRNVLTRMVDLAVFVPISFPGIVLGISLMWTYMVLPIKIYGTIWILLVAYLTRFISHGMRFSNAAVLQVHVELEEAAQVHGGSWWQTIRNITFPLMGPGLLVGWLYVMANSFRELSVSVLLYSARTEVIAVNVFNLWDNGKIGPATALGVLIVLVLTFVVLLTRILASRTGVVAD